MAVAALVSVVNDHVAYGAEEVLWERVEN